MEWSDVQLTRAASAWIGETPSWAETAPVGWVDYYLRWRDDSVPASRPGSRALWGFKVGHGGKWSCGVLGATFEPHEWPYLRLRVGASVSAGPWCPPPFENARVGLSMEYVGGVLAAAPESAALGPGTVVFDQAATHEVDSSWEVFRLLGIGVLRLLARDANDPPDDVLPYFGGSTPLGPGFNVQA